MVEFDRTVFIAKFQEEAQDLLQRLNEAVITLEGSPKDRALVEQMLRDAHTLKGSARMVGLIEVSDVAHRLEDIMVMVRDGQITYTPEMSDGFFEALDAIVFLTEHSGVNEGDALDLVGLQARLTAMAVATSAAVVESADGPVRGTHPPRAEDDWSGTCPEDVSLAGATTAGESELKPKVQSTVRVRTGQVDNLLNLVGEVVISQIKAEQRTSEIRALQTHASRLAKAWTRVKSQLPVDGDTASARIAEEDLEALDSLIAEHVRGVGTFAKAHTDDVSRTSLTVHELQDQGMRLRMLPVDTVFRSFPRAVRDLARQFHKEIDLVIEGGDTELDKKVLEEINDPLVHIVRNAIDHGIEDSARRLALGKPAQGTIKLSARQEGDRIVIEVSDDGAGLDPEAIKAAAVRKGYVSAAEAAGMSDREAMYLIFEAGLSTAAIITEISGRGVGMDVVREFVIERLKGALDVRSERGVGTTFTLTIPLTLAIIRALLLKAGGQTFAFPTSAIDETLRIDPAEVIKMEGRDVIRRGRRTIPLVHLSDLLGIRTQRGEGAKVPIVTIGHSGHRMGFVVDGFEGEQQIVIKSLGSHLQRVDNVAGVTVLGAGTVVPILSVPDLMTNARVRSGQRAAQSEPREHEQPHRQRPRVLICEDSFTTRELERSIFEAAGYEVETAVDGAAGLSRLLDGLLVDAVVTDVQMPNMTGFDLTRMIKRNPALSGTPVVIVTSLERDEEKAEGIEAGADAYITKSVFNQETLLDTVERLIG